MTAPIAQHPTQKPWKWWLALGLIALLTGEIVLLIQRNRELEDSIKSLSGATHPEHSEPLKPGDQAKPIKVLTLSGDTMDIRFDGTEQQQRHLLFVLSTTCPHCENSLVYWNKLASDYGRTGDCTVIGISVHDVEKTMAFHERKGAEFFMTSAVSDTSFSRKYKINGVPETILIGKNGIVEKVWIGALTEERLKEIAELLKA